MFSQPAVQVFVAYALQEGGAVNLYIVLRLLDVDPVKQSDKPKTFERDGEVVVDEIEDLLCDRLQGGSDRKIIHLSEKENSVSMDTARVETGFVCGGCEADGAERHASPINGVLPGDLAWRTGWG